MIKTIRSALSQFFFPSRCPSCRAYTEDEGQWCDACLSEILRLENLAYDSYVRRYISPVITIGRYDKGLRRLIHELKYKRRMNALQYLTPLFAALDDTWQFDDYDLFISVPLHPKKLKQRGFNQTELIFKPWLDSHGFKYSDILIRQKQTKSQYRLNKDERRINLLNAFSLKNGVNVANARCLLLDDIFTSGTTLACCADVLRQNGAQSVAGLVLASRADG